MTFRVVNFLLLHTVALCNDNVELQIIGLLICRLFGQLKKASLILIWAAYFQLNLLISGVLILLIYKLIGVYLHSLLAAYLYNFLFAHLSMWAMLLITSQFKSFKPESFYYIL